MHLTNYAINKKSKNFQVNSDENDETGHKRNLPFVFKHLEANGFSASKTKAKINDLITKTMCSV